MVYESLGLAQKLMAVLRDAEASNLRSKAAIQIASVLLEEEYVANYEADFERRFRTASSEGR